MGVADHEERREWPLAPPREPGPQLTTIAASLTIALALYLAGEVWLRDDKRPPPTAPASPSLPSPAGKTPDRMAASATLPGPHTQRPGDGAVMKCTAQGRISYSDSPCPPGASATPVRIQAGLNIADAVPMPQPKAPPVVVAAAQPPQMQLAVAAPPDRTAVKYLCQALEDEVKYIDALARQPQSAGTQDELAARRKKARDEQFRIRC